jgi:hypothetical protein
LLAAADDGLNVILALEMVRATHKLEHAIEKLGVAISRRAAVITVDFDRVEAAALDRAAEIGVRLHAPFALKWDRTRPEAPSTSCRARSAGLVDAMSRERRRPQRGLLGPSNHGASGRGRESASRLGNCGSRGLFPRSVTPLPALRCAR